jgi:hypothetical protein
MSYKEISGGQRPWMNFTVREVVIIFPTYLLICIVRKALNRAVESNSTLTPQWESTRPSATCLLTRIPLQGIALVGAGTVGYTDVHRRSHAFHFTLESHPANLFYRSPLIIKQFLLITPSVEPSKLTTRFAPGGPTGLRCPLPGYVTRLAHPRAAVVLLNL